MLFHNRHVKAAMGSVIANGGVQLNRAQSLEGMFQSSQLYIWGLSANDLSGKVKVGVSGCIGNQFSGRQLLILSVLLLLSFNPPNPPFFPTGSSLAAGRRVGSWVILTVCQVGRVYESQTLIGSWHCCQLAFWQTIRPYPSSEHLQIQRSGKVGIGNQGNHYYHWSLSFFTKF